MSRVVYAVYTWVPEDILGEWNAWHSGVHIPNVLKAPEMRRAVKLRVTDTSLEGWQPQYVTLYTLDSMEAYAAYRDGYGLEMREEYDKRYKGVGKVARVVMVEEPPRAGDHEIEVRSADTAEDIRAVRELFLEYADSLGFDLSFQDFEREVTTLPGEYANPRGALLIAMDGSIPEGCVALRPWGDANTCEMKRLYVRASMRGRGVGSLLVRRIIDEARARGYRRMRLDTVPGMDPAITLYRGAGFREIAPYRLNPVHGALFMELEL